jgi:hypothetical protein
MAHESGSTSAASARATPSGIRTQFATGAATSSAAAPGRLTPIAFHRSHRLLRPMRQ